MIKKINLSKQKRGKWIRPSGAKIWYEVKLLSLLCLGTLIVSAGYVTFQVPHNIVAGGLSGLSIIITEFTGWPVGLLYWVMNMPLLLLGFFQLGRWSFLFRTLIAATIFSISTDFLLFYLPQLLPQFPLTDDMLLNTIYGGIVGGIGGGLIYRAGGTMGGTGIIGRVIQRRTGKPLSAVYFYTDGLIILLSGAIFGWIMVLYGFLMLFLNGLASDYTLEGPSTTRTANIITNNPEVVIQALMSRIHRGVSYWPVTGGYTGVQRYLVQCTVRRPQVNELKLIISEVDKEAFVTIGISHEALGSDFAPLPK
ncbi:MAG: YitT family protein [Chloroflexi bacterium]|nr:YitT family protein [Chloroflexota bacterium]